MLGNPASRRSSRARPPPTRRPRQLLRVDRRAAQDDPRRGRREAEARWVVAEGADAAALTRSVPLEKSLDDALLSSARTASGCARSRAIPCACCCPASRGNMSVKCCGASTSWPSPLIPRGDLQVHRSMPDGTARQFTFVMEAKSINHAPLRHAADRRGLQRDHRPRLERARAHHRGRGFGRWRRRVAGRALAGRRC